MNKTEITKGSPQLSGVSTNRITPEMAGSVPDTITDIAGFTPKAPTPTLRTHAGCLFSNFCLFESYYTLSSFQIILAQLQVCRGLHCVLFLPCYKKTFRFKIFRILKMPYFSRTHFFGIRRFWEKSFFSIHQEFDIFS